MDSKATTIQAERLLIRETADDTSWMDNLRALATVAVIMLHVAAIPVSQYRELTAAGQESYWHAGNLFDSMVRFCVPIFVMLSGALLIPKELSFSVFLSKRIKRIVLPFLFWSSIYTLFNLSLKVKHGVRLDLKVISDTYVMDILEGASVHLWYVYMIIGLYLFIPVIAPWMRKASRQELVFFIAIWGICMIISQFTSNQLNHYLTPVYFTGYIGYLVLGYFLAHRLTINTTSLIAAIALGVTGFIVTFLGTYLSTRAAGEFSHKWYDYLSLNVALMAAGIFIVVRQIKGRLNGINTMRNLITKYGFGIYLVHVLVLHIIHALGITYRITHVLLSIPLLTLMCLFISIAIVLFINRLPGGKYVSG